ncbi:hypothetical protein QKU48_gp0702 [Fadolivirus algeromassiliense]|jgi:hypothetical protein|uniref:Uncharacterized protein n=1 Tax=Fadolivirus FV1/VV64 TaxID=3070911 RepID=A0A7D3QX59_9VIRU|nr:hypothetical protein QKU48_gp0702 [Fadolivirus algeromassiliense]QKF94160.1 hypothetical protein Fadolivirus_1_702 [Fadolivirus FV1/VV64]
MANQVTQKAGLTFNVNTVKAKLKDYYESQSATAPMFSGGHTALTAVLECLWERILKECVARVGKDKSGVRQVNVEGLQYTVLLHEGLKQYYLVPLSKFDSKQMYKDQVPVSSKELDQVMERVDKDLSLTPRARNLACFLLLTAFHDVANTSTQFLSFAGRKSLNGNCVMHVVSTRFDESVAHELRTEIARAMKAFGEELDETGPVQESTEAKPAAADPQTAPVDEADDGQEPETPAPKAVKKGTKQAAAPADATPAAAPAKKAGGKGGKGKQVDEEEEEHVEEDAGEEETVEAKPKKQSTKAVASTQAAPAKKAPAKGKSN